MSAIVQQASLAERVNALEREMLIKKAHTQRLIRAYRVIQSGAFSIKLVRHTASEDDGRK